MVLAEVWPLLVDIGTVAGILLAIGGVIGLLSKARPVRWLWRQLLGDPVTRWAGRVVDDRVAPVRGDIAELRTDLGTNTTDLSALRTELVTHMGDEVKIRAADITEQGRWQEEVRVRFVRLEGRFVDVDRSIRRLHDRIDGVADGRLEPRVNARARVALATPPVLDAGTADDWIDEARAEDLSGYVTIDMAGTTFVDSRGLGSIVTVIDLVKIAGGRARTVHVPDTARRLIEMAGIESLLGVEH